MITTHEKFGNDKIMVEINWEAKVRPCKKVKFTIAGKEAVIDKSELFALLTIIATNEEQERMMTVKNNEVVGVRKMLSIRTKKAVPEGGTIVFPMTQYMPKPTFDTMMGLGLIKPEDVISMEEAQERMKKMEEGSSVV